MVVDSLRGNSVSLRFVEHGACGCVIVYSGLMQLFRQANNEELSVKWLRYEYFMNGGKRFLCYLYSGVNEVGQ